MRVEDAIRIRRSTRDFAADFMSLDDFAYVLEMAQGHPNLERCPGIELQLAIHRVSGLTPGLYRYWPADHRLQVVRKEPLADDLVRVCLRQKKAGSAAAAFLMVADLGPGRAHASSRRYRDLLLESGAIGQRIYLAAEACGHSARNLAAFVDDSLNRLLGLDEEREAVVHLTMVGPGD
jgi:SagB-type dehydrogenase family enzyme